MENFLAATRFVPAAECDAPMAEPVESERAAERHVVAEPLELRIDPSTELASSAAVAAESWEPTALDADAQPTEPTTSISPAPATHCDPFADLSGDALTTAEALAQQRKGGRGVWAQMQSCGGA